MFLSLRLQTIGVRLLGLIVCLAPVISYCPPSLQNVNVSSGGENTISILSAQMSSGGGGNMTLWVNWGDTPVEEYSATNTLTSFSLEHSYDYSQDLGTGSNIYTL